MRVFTVTTEGGSQIQIPEGAEVEFAIDGQRYKISVEKVAAQNGTS